MRDDPVGMVNKEGINELRERLKNIRGSATTFFNDCHKLQEEGGEYSDIWDDLLPEELRTNGDALRADVKRLSVVQADWQLMLDFSVGDASQSWTMVHHNQTEGGQGRPKEIVHTVCAIVKQAGGSFGH